MYQKVASLITKRMKYGKIIGLLKNKARHFIR